MAFPEGNKLFAGDFRANLDETNAEFTIYKEIELEMDCLTSICTKPKYVHLQGWSLEFICDGWAKYKEKVPNVSDPNQNVETTYDCKLKFT